MNVSIAEIRNSWRAVDVVDATLYLSIRGDMDELIHDQESKRQGRRGRR